MNKYNELKVKPKVFYFSDSVENIASLALRQHGPIFFLMIDWTIFNTYLGNFEKEQVILVVDDFLASYAEMLLKLKTAVSEKDYPTVDQLAHPLKTNCRWFGATVAADLAYDLELMGKRKMEDNMAEVYPKFESAVAELVKELQEYKNALSA